MGDRGDDPNPNPNPDPAATRFLPILLYVLGFMGALALLALAAAWVLRRL